MFYAIFSSHSKNSFDKCIFRTCNFGEFFPIRSLSSPSYRNPDRDSDGAIRIPIRVIDGIFFLAGRKRDLSLSLDSYGYCRIYRRLVLTREISSRIITFNNGDIIITITL